MQYGEEMKKILVSVMLAAAVASCAAPPTGVELSGESPAATPPAAEMTATPQSFIVPQGTPLPDEINAPQIESPSILKIEMLDEVYGWAVTQEHIIRTKDGGATWHDVTPPGLSEAGYSVFSEFLDASHAWLQTVDMNNFPNSGALHRTTDGGLTWESVQTPFSAGHIEFLNSNNGWALADLGVGAGSMAVSVFQTTDGGGTWNRTYTNDPNLENSGDTLPLGGIKTTLAPLTMQTAWVGGVIYAPGEVYLFRTDDGGATWFRINLVLPSQAQEGELAVEQMRFVSDTQGFLILRMTSEHPQSLIFLTGNGGITWQPLSGVFPRAEFIETPSAEEIVFYAEGQFYVTKNAGQTFEVIDPDVDFGDAVLDMSFANSSTGWVVAFDANGKNSLYKTTDGGRTWLAIIP
jgi:photosystem II stability/assembly factor-like uncharacterized protein